MTLVIEVFIFLLIVLGIIVLTLTMFSKDCCIKEVYIREKKNNKKVLVEIKYIGLDDKEIQDISQIIVSGQFNNICDIADDFKVYKKEE